MNESGQSEHISSSISDEELIQDLTFWGEWKRTDSHYSAMAIQRQVYDKKRKSLRLTIAACSVVAATFTSMAWLTNFKRQDASQSEVKQSQVAMQRTQTDPETELLLKSIVKRTQEIGSRIEVLNLRREQQLLAAYEIQELNARLRNFKRVALRNAIVLNQIP